MRKAGEADADGAGGDSLQGEPGMRLGGSTIVAVPSLLAGLVLLPFVLLVLFVGLAFIILGRFAKAVVVSRKEEGDG